MSTLRLPVLGWATKPDSSGNAFFTSYDQYATNDYWKRLVLVFKDVALFPACHGGFTVPKNYVGSAKFVVVWTTTATSGDVKYQLEYRAVGGNDTTSLDQATVQEALTVVDTAPGAAHRRLEASMTATAANFAADSEVEFVLYRLGNDAADTLAADALVFALLFEFADA